MDVGRVGILEVLERRPPVALPGRRVVLDEADVLALEEHPRLGVAAQTTQAIEKVHERGLQPAPQALLSILAGLARKDKSVLPPNGFLEVEIRIVKKDNVESFWEELKKLRQ